MAETYPRSLIPEPYQRMVRSELRKIPTWKLQKVYGKLKVGEPTGIDLVERDRAYAISAIEEALWERGKLPTKGSHSSGVALITEKEWNRAFELTVPLLSAVIGSVSVVLGVMALRASPLGQRIYYQDGQYLVSVRHLGQWHDLRDFVQPSNPDVLAVYSQYGPDSWNLYDFVCRNIDYRKDIGEYWLTPSETLQGYGDCEDTSILLTSLIRAGGGPNCYVALGTLGGYGHAWCEYNGQVMETTYISALPVPNLRDYCPYCYFNDSEVKELWAGSLEQLFELERDEATKLSLIAKALEAV